MEISELTGFLTDYGLEYRENEKSIIMKSCPHCGSTAWKLYFQIDRSRQDKPDGALLGKCYKCKKGYNTISYLLACDIGYPEIMELHGTNRITIHDNAPLILGKTLQLSEGIEDVGDISKFSLDNFVSMSDWPTHPAAVYAKSRGVPEELYQSIYIDFTSCSVVFVCKEDDKVVGYQKRLLYPPNPHMKAMSPKGFKKSQHILQFPRPGKDILVCEGPFTGVSAYMYGFHAVVTFGAGVSANQLKKIAGLAKENNVKVAIGYDMDIAGTLGYYRIFNSMDRFGIQAYRVKPEFGNDLNDSHLEHKGFIIENLLTVDPTIPYLGNIKE